MRHRFNDDLTYEAWIGWLFDRPVEVEPQFGTWDNHDHESAAYLNRLFANARESLRPYSEAQIAQGLTHVIDPGQGFYICTLFEPDPSLPPGPYWQTEAIAWSSRAQALRSIPSLFEQIFAPVCGDDLGHHRGGTRTPSPLRDLGYMWWDILSFATGRLSLRCDGELIQAMSGQLDIPAASCQESGLHGLGHWQPRAPDLIARIVDHYLARSHILPELRAYAQEARDGSVL